MLTVRPIPVMKIPVESIWYVARVWDVPVGIHRSWLSVGGLGAVFVLVSQEDLSQACSILLSVLLPLLAVLGHELGHAWMARRQGLAVRHVVLHMGYGAAQVELPKNPRQELLVAVAGPATNILLLLPGLPWVPWHGFAGTGDAVPMAWAVANGGLGLVNLLPAFPMDGGRVLRASLWARMELERATQIATWVGRVLAALVVALGFHLGGPLVGIALTVPAGVVMVMGSRELSRVRNGLPVDAPHSSN